jgi:cytoskeletal protein RodZ
VTLLPPLKHLTALKLPKLSIFVGIPTPVEMPQPQTPIIAEPDPLPPTASERLYQIGIELRQVREQYHLSIEDMSIRTQVQPRLIQAIEEGHLEMLPESVYVKGMVKRYGNSLGLDGIALSQQVPTWEGEPDAFSTVTRQTTGFSPTTPQVKPLHVYLGYTLAIFGIGAGTSHLINNAIRPPSKPMIGASRSQHRSISNVTPSITSSPQLPGIPVGIAVKHPAWAQIGIDGTTKFTGTLKVGMQLNWVAQQQVTISTNNAGGLLFARDRQPMQPLGKIGQKQVVTIKVGKYN